MEADKIVETAGRNAWHRDYVETQVQRDVRDLSRIRSLDALPRRKRKLAVSIGSCTSRPEAISFSFEPVAKTEVEIA